MIKQQTRYLCSIGKFTFVLLSFCISMAYAQETTELSRITEVELATLAEGAATQEQVETLDDRRMQLVANYRTTLKQNSNLKKYNAQLSQTIQSQQEEMQALEQQINRISNLERDIVPLMSDMVDALEEFIALDLPFLQRERTERSRKLRELLVNGNVSNSERYRRILEAYQIENDYGRTIEAYEDKTRLPNSSEKQTVTFLKIGRIAYLLQTLDGQRSFFWHRQQKNWQTLDKRYNDPITKGIKMAKEQIPSNLMFVPVIAPSLASQTNF